MKKIEDACCDCAVPSYPCLGYSCPNRNIIHYYCDKCKDDAEELFEYNDKELCEDCLREKVNKQTIVCSNCGEHTELFDLNGKSLCFTCLKENLFKGR